MENRSDRGIGVVQQIIRKGILYAADEIRFLTIFHGRLDRFSSLEIYPADEGRQLGRKVDHLFLR